MQGDQKFEIEENLESTVKFGIFAKYIFPIIVPIFLGLVFIAAAVLLVPFLFTFFPDMDIRQIGGGIVTIIILILILAIPTK